MVVEFISFVTSPIKRAIDRVLYIRHSPKLRTLRSHTRILSASFGNTSKNECKSQIENIRRRTYVRSRRTCRPIPVQFAIVTKSIYFITRTLTPIIPNITGRHIGNAIDKWRLKLAPTRMSKLFSAIMFRRALCRGNTVAFVNWDDELAVEGPQNPISFLLYIARK